MKSKKPTTASFAVTPTIQRLFISIAVLAYGINVGMPVYYMLTSPGGGASISGLLPWVVNVGVMPLLLALIAWQQNPKRKKLPRLHLVFETILLATAGLSVTTVMLQFSSLTSSWILGNSGSYWKFTAYEYGVQLFGAMLFAGLLVWLRRNKHWS